MNSDILSIGDDPSEEPALPPGNDRQDHDGQLHHLRGWPHRPAVGHRRRQGEAGVGRRKESDHFAGQS